LLYRSFEDFFTFHWAWFIILGRKVVSLDEYASLFENIDPLSEYKKWTANQVLDRSVHPMNTVPRYDVSSEAVKAVFVVSDPVDWGRDIQVFILFM
jgi:hypothetical protein